MMRVQKNFGALIFTSLCLLCSQSTLLAEEAKKESHPMFVLVKSLLKDQNAGDVREALKKTRGTAARNVAASFANTVTLKGAAFEPDKTILKEQKSLGEYHQIVVMVTMKIEGKSRSREMTYIGTKIEKDWYLTFITDDDDALEKKAYSDKSIYPLKEAQKSFAEWKKRFEEMRR